MVIYPLLIDLDYMFTSDKIVKNFDVFYKTKKQITVKNFNTK